MQTIALAATPISTFAPSTGCDDEVAVHPMALVYTLDIERSEMWLVHQSRKELLEDVWRVVEPYGLPAVLSMCNGHAVGILGAVPGLCIVDHQGREVCPT